MRELCKDWVFLITRFTGWFPCDSPWLKVRNSPSFSTDFFCWHRRLHTFKAAVKWAYVELATMINDSSYVYWKMLEYSTSCLIYFFSSLYFTQPSGCFKLSQRLCCCNLWLDPFSQRWCVDWSQSSLKCRLPNRTETFFWPIEYSMSV